MHLKQIIEQADTGAGRVFDFCIQSLILISLLSFAVESLPDLGAGVQTFLRVLEIFVVMVFTMEYLLRTIVADRKLKFIFSFYGLIDVLAILPFYVTTGIDLRSIRIFRLFRLFRAFKLVRYNKAIRRLRLAFVRVKAELMIFMIATAFLLYISAVGIYYFEHAAQPKAFASVFHAVWWAIVTLTTVGYGDAYPITVGGKIFTFFILVIGLGIVAVPTGLIAAALSEGVDGTTEE